MPLHATSSKFIGPMPWPYVPPLWAEIPVFVYIRADSDYKCFPLIWYAMKHMHYYVTCCGDI